LKEGVVREAIEELLFRLLISAGVIPLREAVANPRTVGQPFVFAVLKIKIWRLYVNRKKKTLPGRANLYSGH
jgi:hypothetical protein